MNPTANRTKQLLCYNWQMSALTLVFLIVAFTIVGQARAQQANPLDAVVNLKAVAPPNSRLADVLGTFREGSGIVIDDQGLILTIGYLILEASDVAITKANGEIIPADVVAYDYDTGLGLVRTNEPLDIEPIAIGNSSQVTSGSKNLLASLIGEPNIHAVEVADIRLFAGFWEYLLEEAIFTTPIVRSFAGGALIDESGALIGVGYLAVRDATQGVDETAGNMFVPIDSLKPILKDLVKHGRRQGPARPWMGLYTEMDRGHLFVTRLADEGPAEKAGVLAGDIVVSANGFGIKSMADLFTTVWSAGDAGVEVNLEVLRGGEINILKIKTEDRYQWLRLDPLSKYTASVSITNPG